MSDSLQRCTLAPGSREEHEAHLLFEASMPSQHASKVEDDIAALQQLKDSDARFLAGEIAEAITARLLERIEPALDALMKAVARLEEGSLALTRVQE